ncbi:hypothetical protein JCM8097_009558 [Rhodosporidiobolus ruineniae]
MAPPPQTVQVGSVFPTWSGVDPLDIAYQPVAAANGFVAANLDRQDGSWHYGCPNRVKGECCDFKTVFHLNKHKNVFVVSSVGTEHDCPFEDDGGPSEEERRKAEVEAQEIVKDAKRSMLEEAEKLMKLAKEEKRARAAPDLEQQQQIVRDLVPVFGQERAMKVEKEYRDKGYLHADYPRVAPLFPQPGSWPSLTSFTTALNRFTKDADFSAVPNTSSVPNEKSWRCDVAGCGWVATVFEDENELSSRWRFSAKASTLEHDHAHDGEGEYGGGFEQNFQTEGFGGEEVEEQNIGVAAGPSSAPQRNDRPAKQVQKRLADVSPFGAPVKKKKTTSGKQPEVEDSEDDLVIVSEQAANTYNACSSRSHRGPSSIPSRQTPRAPSSTANPQPATSTTPHPDPSGDSELADFLANLVPGFASKIRQIFVPLLVDELGVETLEDLEQNYTGIDNPEEGVKELMGMLRDELLAQKKHYKAPMQKLEAALLEYVRRGGYSAVGGVKKEEPE